MLHKAYFIVLKCASSDVHVKLRTHTPAKPGTECEITSTLKPNAPLGNTVEDLRKLGEYRTKREHVITVGGSGNSPDRNYRYSIEKDINFNAERSNKTIFGFANLF